MRYSGSGSVLSLGCRPALLCRLACFQRLAYSSPSFRSFLPFLMISVVTGGRRIPAADTFLVSFFGFFDSLRRKSRFPMATPQPRYWTTRVRHQILAKKGYGVKLFFICCSAERAASASADFLFLPEPVPRTVLSSLTSTVNVLL